MSEIQNVVISGAGPVGCVIALILARSGVPVTLLESENILVKDMRASTFHPPTLEMLEEYGLTSKLIEAGRITPIMQYRDFQEGLLVEFDHTILKNDTRYPYRLQCEQFKLARFAAEMLEEYDHANIIYGARAMRAIQSEDGVVVRYASDDGEKEIHASYVVGCDGAGSAIRKSSGIEFEGFTYPESFVILSTTADISADVPDLSDIAYISDPDLWCVVIRAPEVWRLMYPADPEMSEDEMLSDENLQKCIKKVTQIDREYPIWHRTHYRVHQRVAANFRQGRVFLAGDAAHLNNPIGGMGLNSGIHDAVSLAPRLIEVIKNGADQSLLDEYEAQRRPAAIDFVQANSIRNKKAMEERDPVVRKQRQVEMAEVAADPQKSRDILMKTTMLHSFRNVASS